VTDETEKPQTAKPAKGPNSAPRTNGAKGRYLAKEISHDLAFDIYYAMGPTRSYHNAVRKILDETGEKVSVQSISRWAAKEGWQDRVKARDIETGANIAAALKLLEERGQKISAAHFKGLVGHGLETAERAMYGIGFKTVSDLAEFITALIDIDRYAAEMSKGVGSMQITADNGKVVNMGDFTAAARAVGAAAGNGKDPK